MLLNLSDYDVNKIDLSLIKRIERIRLRHDDKYYNNDAAVISFAEKLGVTFDESKIPEIGIQQLGYERAKAQYIRYLYCDVLGNLIFNYNGSGFMRDEPPPNK